MNYQQWLAEIMKKVDNERCTAAAPTAPAPKIDIDHMRRTIEDIEFAQRVSAFAGLTVVVVQDSIEHRPNMQLSARVCEILSPEMIASTNAWMVEFFGTTPIVRNWLKDDQAIVYQQQREVYMNPRMYARFLKATADYRR